MVKPFLKWAGGKRKLIKDISMFLPSYLNDSDSTYVEPFVGGGSVLFSVLENFPNIGKVVINDINADLMNVYNVIIKDPTRLIEILQTLQNEYFSFEHDTSGRKAYYYQKRHFFNLRTQNSIEHAALFIFLNKTCFNGLYRVNRKNEFNVPIGSYETPLICDKQNILNANEILQKVTILNLDYYQTLMHIDGKKCFFYLDPPYKPLNNTANFNKYSHYIFDDDQQIRLKEFCELLNNEGIKWVLSNSDLKNHNKEDLYFDDLYKNFNINRVSVNRVINNNSKKKKIKEILVNNYLKSSVTNKIPNYGENN